VSVWGGCEYGEGVWVWGAWEGEWVFECGEGVWVWGGRGTGVWVLGGCVGRVFGYAVFGEVVFVFGRVRGCWKGVLVWRGCVGVICELLACNLNTDESSLQTLFSLRTVKRNYTLI
jgi:hypothetical protein